MKNDDLYAVLMAGGVGSRFWPQSRRERPKQLLKIFSDRQMITETSERLTELVPAERQIIVTNELQKEGISNAVRGVIAENILIEPYGRNTAPCIGLAAVFLERLNPEAVMVVLPADHLISNKKRFLELLSVAAEFASEKNYLVTLGIKPSYPETGYGYIQAGESLALKDGVTISSVKTFAEKPNLETAKRFLESGDFSWNSGMFIWKVKTILEEIEEYMPDLFDGLMEIKSSLGTSSEKEVIAGVYKTLKKVSIDYGIMERSSRVATLSGDFGWNDVGSWDVVYDLVKKRDEDENVVLDNAETVFINSGGNLISSSRKKLISLVDINNLIIIDTGDALLICPRGSSQDVKHIVDQLQKQHKDEYL